MNIFLSTLNMSSDSSSDEEELLILAAVSIFHEKRKRRGGKRRVWVREIYRERHEFGIRRLVKVMKISNFFLGDVDFRGAPPHVSEGSAAPLLCANVYESVENEMGNTLIC